MSAPDPATAYVDSHCHLYDTRGADVADVVAGARAAGVTTMVNVGCDAATTAAAIAIAERFEGVHATAGLHPHEARHGVETIVEHLDHPSVVAVGEAGLDHHYEHSPAADQRRAFAAQIQLAHERSLPLVIHTREAWAETFDILDGEGMPERTVFHCFTGGPDELRECLARGAFVSFSGIVTFKAAVDLHEAARRCPLDRLLVETDSPYLAPVPHRGRTNAPAHVPLVVAAIATLRDDHPDIVRRATVENAFAAFPRLAKTGSAS